MNENADEYIFPKLDYLPQNELLDLKWNTEEQVQLLKGIAKFRPVGIHRHFRMINLYLFFNKNSSSKAQIAQIWTFLKELYDLEYLDAVDGEYNSQTLLEIAKNFSQQCMEGPPPAFARNKKNEFNIKTRNGSGSNEQTSVVDFDLPISDFYDLVLEKRQATEIVQSDKESVNEEDEADTESVEEENEVSDQDDDNASKKINKRLRGSVSKKATQKSGKKKSAAKSTAKKTSKPKSKDSSSQLPSANETSAKPTPRRTRSSNALIEASTASKRKATLTLVQTRKKAKKS